MERSGARIGERVKDLSSGPSTRTYARHERHACGSLSTSDGSLPRVRPRMVGGARLRCPHVRSGSRPVGRRRGGAERVVDVRGRIGGLGPGGGRLRRRDGRPPARRAHARAPRRGGRRDRTGRRRPVRPPRLERSRGRDARARSGRPRRDLPDGRQRRGRGRVRALLSLPTARRSELRAGPIGVRDGSRAGRRGERHDPRVRPDRDRGGLGPRREDLRHPRARRRVRRPRRPEPRARARGLRRPRLAAICSRRSIGS